MGEQLFFEDVEIGGKLPVLVKRCTTRQLVKWAGASENFARIHYDQEEAKRRGLPNVVTMGRLKVSFLAQMITDWIGPSGRLKRLEASYRKMDFPDQDLLCKGRITNKFTKNDGHWVECEIWTENSQGDRTTTGKAMLTLPKKGSVNVSRS